MPTRLGRVHDPPPRPRRWVASTRAGSLPFRLVNAAELFDFITSIEGSRESGSEGNGLVRGRLLSGVEYALASEPAETRLRAAWRRRQGGAATPLVLIADDPDEEGRLVVLGPQGDGPVRAVRADALRDLITRTAEMGELSAVRTFAQEIERLDAETVAGLAVKGLGTRHLYETRLPDSPRWTELGELAEHAQGRDWIDVLKGLGYDVRQLEARGYLASHGGRPAIVVHPHTSPEEFARLEEDGRLREGALLANCEQQGAPYGILAAGTRMRLFRAAADEGGAATRYLELDANLIESEMRPLLGLLAPSYLAEGGLEEVLAEARDYGSRLRLRLDRALRQEVLPRLGRELGRWAETQGLDLADDAVREELETAALTFVFRALFLLYAESAGYLPMAHETYRQRSLTTIARRAAEELGTHNPAEATLWGDVRGLVEAMRTGKTPWGVPPYNGDLFAADGLPGAETLEAASIPDRELAPALVALARDPDDPEGTGVDFSGLEIGHLGHIYEGLLSLRLTVADRGFRYDERSDRYVDPDEEEVDVRAGELLWLTNEGGRKGGGVYYTRTELVRHLVKGAVRPALERHLHEVRELAEKNPAAAAARLFDFFVLDPACGSAHFLVEVVEEIADRIATLLGEVPLPAIRDELDALRSTAGRAFGIEIEDAALLKRLVLKRCAYGVDLSPMGAEIAKLSLWLASFVPGLSLQYLDHNIRVGNSLIGVAAPGDVADARAELGQVPMFGDSLDTAITAAARDAARLHQIPDRTPDEFEQSREAGASIEERLAAARALLDLWVAEPLGFKGSRADVLTRGEEILAGKHSLDDSEALAAAREQAALHWPLAFPEVFARERPGFDVVVGNPPWEEVNVDELTFYAFYKPGLRALPETARLGAIGELLNARPEIADLLQGERERLAALRGALGPSSGYVAGPGNADLYEFFCQRYRDLLRVGGFLGVVLPRSAFLTKGSEGFREWLFGDAAPRRVDFLLNSGRWAFDSEPRYTVALLTAERREPEPEEAFESAGVAASAEEFARQSTAPGIKLERTALGPGLEVPLLSGQAEADLLAKLRRGEPFPLGCGRWRCFPVQGDFNETSDRGLWQNAQDGRSLWKGESFDQYDPHGAEERVCPASDEVMAKVRKPRPGSGSLLAEKVPLPARREAVARTVERARVAFRDVSRATDSRTIRACLIPPQHFLLNSAPYLAFVDDNPGSEAACLALMNSLVLDWQARRFVETHLNFFVLEGFKLPALDEGTAGGLAERAARLSCVDDRFADFAAGCGVECGPLEEEERNRVRVEVDALVARAWNLTADELDLVFTDFTEDAVSPDYRDAVRVAFAELG